MFSRKNQPSGNPSPINMSNQYISPICPPVNEVSQCCSGDPHPHPDPGFSSWHRAGHRAAGGSYDPWGPAIVPFAGCLGRIRHPEQRVDSNMFCYVVFLTGFCPCPAPKLKSDMIPWGVRPSAFVFTWLQEGYRQSWITHDPGKARVRDESGEGDPAKSWKLGTNDLSRNQLRRLRGIGFSWCSWGFDV